MNAENKKIMKEAAATVVIGMAIGLLIEGVQKGVRIIKLRHIAKRMEKDQEDFKQLFEMVQKRAGMKPEAEKNGMSAVAKAIRN